LPRPPDGVVKINSHGVVNVNDNLAATRDVAREGVASVVLRVRLTEVCLIL
jgi:hypothetical protein